MKHEMKLQERYYNYIKNGTKRIELRLFDEKRSNVNIGDSIKFINITTGESFTVEATGLIRYKSFKEMLRDFDVDILADKSMTKEELLDVLNKIYSTKDQEKYGVLGIRIDF